MRARVSFELNPLEILYIYSSIQIAVQEHNGLDYFQVFADDRGRKLYFLDELNDEMLASDHYNPEDNHCTLLFLDEY